MFLWLATAYQRFRIVATLLAGFIAFATSAPAAGVEYVILISVDALHAGAVPALGPVLAPNFWRFRTEGSFTDNARTDYQKTDTTPNHSSILTGRPVFGESGHLWNDNSRDPLSLAPSIHHPHTFYPAKRSYEYVTSVFDIAHDHGLRTALYYGKTRLDLFAQSYNDTYGATDTIGTDNGRNKIDSALYLAGWRGADLTNAWMTEMDVNPFQFTFLHFAETDIVGHHSTWDIPLGSDYLDIVREVDGYLGQIFDFIENDARFAGKTVILLTTDHGGRLGTTSHHLASHIDNYRVPFYAWGPGLLPGGDLYEMNPQYSDPGTERPDYSDPDNQPIRNGDMSNLVLKLLGLPPVPGSTINADQSLAVTTSVECGPPNLDGAVDTGIFLWKDCQGDTWHLRATAGVGWANYKGSIVSNQPFLTIEPVDLESTDVLDTGDPTRIDFDLTLAKPWQDGFDFSFPPEAHVEIRLVNPAEVFLGANRAPVNDPFTFSVGGVCGPPIYDGAVDMGIFLWQGCQAGTWHLRATAGVGSAQFIGSIVSSQPFLTTVPVGLEANDNLDTDDPTRIDFDLKLWAPWQDGFDFSFPSDAHVEMQLVNPADVFYGAHRAPVSVPLPLGLGVDCGPPSYDGAVDAAIFLWQDCQGGAWHLRATAGDGSAQYVGSIVSNQIFLTTVPVGLEANDVLDTGDPMRIDFDLTMGKFWQDGFDFSFPPEAHVELLLASPADVFLGANRLPVSVPFPLNAGSP